ELAGKEQDALREMKKLLLGHAGLDLARRFDRESHVARTSLRPTDPAGGFVGALRGRTRAAGVRGAIERGAAADSPAAAGRVPSWHDPFVPTIEADDEFVRMMDALSQLQEAATRSVPTPVEAADVTDRLL